MESVAPTEGESQRSRDLRLSTISAQYDRGNKGYLDDTEKKLRAMDSENLGHLDIHKVYALMQEFQAEQKKAVGLKRSVIALAAFAVLLCLANIGTSFAAAKLAKDTSVESNYMVVKETGEMIGVGVRVPVVVVREDPTASVRRDLTETATGDSASGFVITDQQADAIYSRVCSGWPGMANYQGNSGFPCGTGGEETLEHCSQGFHTKLSHQRKPRFENGVFTFYYNAKRDDWVVDDVEIVCDTNTAVNGKFDCQVKNINCYRTCRKCTQVRTKRKAI